ncbi:hypothetical protein PP744_gp096 [Rhizobium phage RHph_N38]|uniref:Uncharacterized protein n=1 Tax=Rhizobium phage RHph_N38 TaxID=2509750 RepID=A0A7S5REE3_9CAUD|nr:hypothetical protein PP744_gp096 [Rhizobium phage RHph_N38]QIG70559.1 hypothetical protein EVB89_098 [Rhizobium phage RHph_N38]
MTSEQYERAVRLTQTIHAKILQAVNWKEHFVSLDIDDVRFLTKMLVREQSDAEMLGREVLELWLCNEGVSQSRLSLMSTTSLEEASETDVDPST